MRDTCTAVESIGGGRRVTQGREPRRDEEWTVRRSWPSCFDMDVTRWEYGWVLSIGGTQLNDAIGFTAFSSWQNPVVVSRSPCVSDGQLCFASVPKASVPT
jgi:hypothetical protein